jgi:hypothetical protein
VSLVPLSISFGQGKTRNQLNIDLRHSTNHRFARKYSITQNASHVCFHSEWFTVLYLRGIHMWRQTMKTNPALLEVSLSSQQFFLGNHTVVLFIFLIMRLSAGMNPVIITVTFLSCCTCQGSHILNSC